MSGQPDCISDIVSGLARAEALAAFRASVERQEKLTPFRH